MDFIVDALREQKLKITNRRIAQKRSVLWVGEFGTGKTALLNQLNKQHPNARRLSGLGGLAQILGEMAGEPDTKTWRKNDYIKTIRRNPQLIFIDEAQHLNKALFPYLKDFIEHDNVFLLAGLNTVVGKMLDSNNQDVLSRFMQIEIHPVPIDDLQTALTDFTEEAFIEIYTSSESTRVLTEVVDDCRYYATENGITLITLDIAKRIIAGEL